MESPVDRLENLRRCSRPIAVKNRRDSKKREPRERPAVLWRPWQATFRRFALNDQDGRRLHLGSDALIEMDAAATSRHGTTERRKIFMSGENGSRTCCTRPECSARSVRRTWRRLKMSSRLSARLLAMI